MSAVTIGFIFKNRLSKAGGFAQADATGDHTAEDKVFEMIAHLADDLLPEIGTLVEHRHEDTAKLEALVNAGIAKLIDDL